MIEYKLIKEYPGSPPLGTKIDENGFDGSMTTLCNPEKYPEFWEKIDEKAYEVLSFIGKEFPRIYKLQNNGSYLCEEDR